MDRPFLKVLLPDGYKFEEPAVQLIKVAADGLRGNDLKALIKRAGHQFADRLKKADLKAGDVPVHLIAFGSTEDYGPNRNGDGFKRTASRNYHNTFVKFARWYRHHANKDPRKSYGLVKYSTFNESMKRVELICFLNGTKEAADRNNGLLADEELDLIGKNEDIPVSMSCRVPFDICSGCGNRARNRDEYCLGTDEGGHCKAGGLRNRIGLVTGDPDNPILHADNTEPVFFDISRVIRPADRIAYSFGLMKAAGAADPNKLLSGAELADLMGLSAPRELLATGEAAVMYKLARQLAECEARVEADAASTMKLAFVEEVQPPTDWTTHNAKIGEVLQALARSRIALPLEGFLQIIHKDPVKAANAAQQVRPYLPGIYSQLLRTGELDELVKTNSFTPTTSLAPLAVRRWAEKRAGDFSLNRDCVAKRITVGSLRHAGTFRKAASATPPGAYNKASAEVAKHYALYKLAFLRALPDDEDFDLTLQLCVVQNYV